MLTKEFEEFKVLPNEEYPFASKYGFEDCVFYIEPMFISQLEGMKTLRKEEFTKLWNGIKDTIRKYKKVVFVYDFENPYVKDLDGFIYRELTDISDPLHIFVEDKSRGSDYGD